MKTESAKETWAKGNYLVPDGQEEQHTHCPQVSVNYNYHGLLSRAIITFVQELN